MTDTIDCDRPTFKFNHGVVAIPAVGMRAGRDPTQIDTDSFAEYS